MVVRVFPPFPHVARPEPGTGRDAALDVVRAWSLLVVVAGHFLMQIMLWPPGGVPTTSNSLSSGDPWPYATWVFQVMPLFFVAGGAVNATSWRRFDGTWSQWVWQRVGRLMRPTVVFLLAGSAIFTVVSLLVRREVTDALVGGVTGPLWFLAVYIPVTAMTPLTLRWFDRSPLGSCLLLLVAVGVVDVLRLNVAETAGALNLVLAWTLVHQLGYWYDRGVSRPVAGGLVVAGLAANLLLTWRLGWYPPSLVGIPTERFSNMAPPDLVLVWHAATLFGVFVLVAPALRRWVRRPGAFTATARAGMLAMTVYLWHMLVLVGWLVVLHHLRMDLPVRIEVDDVAGPIVVPDGAGYWGWLALSAVGYVAVLWAVARWLWPLEFVRLPWFDAPCRRPAGGGGRTAVGVVLLSAGLLAVSGAGFSGFPLAVRHAYGLPLNAVAALVAVGAGLWLVRRPVPDRVGARMGA